MQQSITKLLGISGLSLASAVVLVPSIGTAQISEIIDATGDGAGNTLGLALRIAVDRSGNNYFGGGVRSDAA